MGRRAGQSAVDRDQQAAGDSRHREHSLEMGRNQCSSSRRTSGCFLDPGLWFTDGEGDHPPAGIAACPGAPSLVTILSYLCHRSQVLPELPCFCSGRSETRNTESKRQICRGNCGVEGPADQAGIQLQASGAQPPCPLQRLPLPQRRRKMQGWGGEVPVQSRMRTPCTAARRLVRVPMWPSGEAQRTSTGGGGVLPTHQQSQSRAPGALQAPCHPPEVSRRPHWWRGSPEPAWVTRAGGRCGWDSSGTGKPASLGLWWALNMGTWGPPH